MEGFFVDWSTYCIKTNAKVLCRIFINILQKAHEVHDINSQIIAMYISE